MRFAAEFEAQVTSAISLADFLALFRQPRPAADVQRVLGRALGSSGDGAAAAAGAPFVRMLLFALRHNLLEPVRTYLFQRPGTLDVRRHARALVEPEPCTLTARTRMLAV